MKVSELLNVNIDVESIDEKTLIMLSKDNNAYAQILYKRYEKLLLKLCHMYANKGLEFEELLCEANYGFTYALQKFDANKNSNKFGTYMVPWVKEKILLAIKNNHRKVSISYGKINTVFKAKAVIDECNKEGMSKEKINEELKKKCGIDYKKYETYKSLMSVEYFEGAPNEFIDDSYKMIDSNILKADAKKVIHDLINALDAEDRIILVSFFYEKKSHKEIAQMLNKKTSYVQNRKVKLLEVMKGELINKGINKIIF